MERARSVVLIFVAIASLTVTATSCAAVWEEESAPLPSGGTQGELRGISCFSSSACTAVGHYWNGSIWGAMGDEWKGTSWASASVVANPGSKNGDLWSVSCFSATRCMAAGAYGSEEGGKGVGHTLTEASNKGTWTHVTSANSGEAPELLGISCLSLEYCVSTGHHSESGNPGIMAEEWEGTGWKLMSPIENPGGQKNGKLWSVICTVESSCRAAGNWGTEPGGIGVPGIETWNGTTWTATVVPEPGAAEFGELYGISCKTANSCMAVGLWREAVTGHTRLLADYWNGTSWSMKLSNGPSGETESQFRGVSCTAEEACIAVGEYRNSSKKEVTLAEIWNGTEWKVQTTPNPSEAAGSILEAVSCTETEVCNAVGHDINSSSILKPIAAHL
jgi:hypothetical protein